MTFALEESVGSVEMTEDSVRVKKATGGKREAILNLLAMSKDGLRNADVRVERLLVCNRRRREYR